MPSSSRGSSSTTPTTRSSPTASHRTAGREDLFVNGGIDVQVWKGLSVTFDGRYTWMHSDLGTDFSGFDGIDLSGFRYGTGISVAF
ncbi:MAG: hypothetical protein QM736_11610 [Vicinamibacterales bacterium]